MKKFTDPLDNVRIASPCPADWNSMYGDNRKRFCGECKMNVFNLSDMTRQEAESLLLNWEGRLCVRFFRRADGTVLTKDCPVGWRAVKQRISRRATALFSVFAGIFAGVAGTWLFEDKPNKTEVGKIAVMGDVAYEPVQGGISPGAESFELGELVDVRGQAVIDEGIKKPVRITRLSQRSARR
ncbi:MAG: hypothetical protein KIT61_05745 [Pyrinomonadaceae bacterium]|nr:hypothetical protein [Pyrinomonadaceae bacterium]